MMQCSCIIMMQGGGMMHNQTIHILESAADTICRHQRQFDPELSTWYQRELTLRQDFFQQHHSNRALRRQVLELLDTQEHVESLKQEFYFRLGLQMGIELGVLDLFPKK